MIAYLRVIKRHKASRDARTLLREWPRFSSSPFTTCTVGRQNGARAHHAVPKVRTQTQQHREVAQ